ncbi:MAG: DUF1573 domain-containing protein, partial [Mariprofundaceae bacterium]|nr:DUF1573 domain-containing protein [Mariprofundaceae bacterium]
MNMKTYWMTLYILVCAMGSMKVWAEAMPYAIQQQAQVVVSGEKSLLVFDPQTLDLGDVLEGENISSYLLIRNTDKQAHQIVHVESSCGCTTANPDTRMLAAGGFTTLHITIDTFGKRGDVKKSMILT